MRKKLRVTIFIPILLLILAVGFAAVSTTLILSGTAIFGTNDDEFDVIFTKALIDGVDVSETTISVDGKSISFATNSLSKIDDESVLNFVITNNSTQYDASVSMNCVADGQNGEYYTITNTLPEIVTASSIANGTVTATLNKLTVNEISEIFTCTIDAIAVERTSIEASSTVKLIYDGDNDNVADFADMIAIGTEEFYVLSSNSNEIRLLAKSYLDYNTNLQSANNVVTPFSSDSQKGSKYSTYSGSIVEGYVTSYANYLSSEYNIDISGTLLSKSDFDDLAGFSLSKGSVASYLPQWMYGLSYWTMTADTDVAIWYMSANGSIFPYYYGNSIGVRPVITISADVLT